MRSNLYSFAFALLLLLVNGCSVMTESECRMADWHTVGFEDGTQGYLSSRIGAYRKDCSDYGVVPDLQAYQAGYQLGLQHYCTVSRGYAVGEQGKQYQGVCPALSEKRFLSGYQRGYNVYQARQRWYAIKQRLSTLRQDLSSLRTELRSKERELIDEGNHAQKRSELVDSMSRLRSRAFHIRSELFRLQSDERWAKEEYEIIRLRNSR
ncbi:DUF2799 domain-containing protein [Zooshikella harenae]|uniref:DUF2799 domain-containing protein n=1 Tax=Zooshikella harenae TaxID=2827238 RepID=A0ABS5ZA64_9GAMM|nr:DUF2799 domain-containing protein [Zooshikella harenae]MBU2710643.1 DUF2799 domain-containing protein [Zooshikella harenae]